MTAHAELLRRYRAGYDGWSQAAGDGGIRAADAYVAACDPLRGRVDEADVALGVDPGGYFCAGLALALAERPGVRAGFLHVPPDATLAPTTARVVERLLAALAPSGRVLVTGFGPFPGVRVNPSEAFVRQRADGVVLRLEDEAGVVFPDMAPVLSQLEAAIGAGEPPEVILALGVDSRQALARPRYTIETQSRGMRDATGRLSRERPVALEAFALAALASGVFTR